MATSTPGSTPARTASSSRSTRFSKNFLDALVAREDSRFYDHHGVDPHGIARAVVRNITRHRAAEGASTLTQQLARNSLPLGGKTLTRKILEAFVALRIERRYTKQQILELYVNRIFYGSGVYGIETASQAYFGKPSSQLDLSESAMMAGLIRSPNRFSPLNNLAAATRERDTVLERMATLHMITPEQSAAAAGKTSRSRATASPMARITTRWRSSRTNSPTCSPTNRPRKAGRRFTPPSTRGLQELATQSLENQLEKIENHPGYEHPKKGQNPDADESHGTDYLQGALVAIENRSGAIRALVGGREYKSRSDFNRATDPPGRPVGSTFKPFVYTAAWARGILPGSRIDDGPIRPGELPLAPKWSPSNSDSTFGGILPAETGLIRSRNTMSVRVGQLAGLDNVRPDRQRGRPRREHSRRPDDLPGHLRHDPAQAHGGLHPVPQLGHPAAGLLHRTHRRRRGQHDLPRPARRGARAQRRLRVDHA